MNKTILLALAVLLASYSGQAAQSSIPVGTGGGIDSTCAPTMDIISVLNVVQAGNINVCIYYNHEVPMADIFHTEYLSYIITGPATPAAGTLVVVTPTLTIDNGCYANPAGFTQSQSTGVFGIVATGYIDIGLDFAHFCPAIMHLTMTVGSLTPLTLVDYYFPIYIQSEVKYQLNYLCAAPNAIPHVFDVHSEIGPNAHPCTDPLLNIGQSGNWNITGSFGNITGNFTGNNTAGPVQPVPGWDGSLYVLLVLFSFALVWLGESGKDNFYRFFAGLILLVASFVSLWEMERLGFNNVLNGYGLGFALPFLLTTGIIGFYLLYPKKWRNKNK